jgi:hypothetical protein
MFKFVKITLFLLFVGFEANAQQPFVMFIDKAGNRVDNKLLANSYMFVKKVDDSAWMVKEFDMRDTILSLAYYKDENLSIPTGKFTAYQKRPPIEGINIKIDTFNHVKISGYFLNGKKDGEWYEFLNGKKQLLKTYKNDIANGLSQTFEPVTGAIFLEGYYVNGQKSGEWHGKDGEGNEIYTDTYVKGKMINHVSTQASNVKSAVMPFDLYTYLKRKSPHFKTPDHTGSVVLNLKISADGTVTDAQIGQMVDEQFDEFLVKAFMESPKWSPAEYKGKKIASKFKLTVNIVDLMRTVDTVL